MELRNSGRAKGRTIIPANVRTTKDDMINRKTSINQVYKVVVLDVIEGFKTISEVVSSLTIGISLA